MTAKKTAVIDAALAKAEETIERAKVAQSKQPRFSLDGQDARNFFNSILGWTKEAIFNEPPYTADSSKRDQWLAKVAKKEPHLLGVLQSVVSIDKNRGWTITGGKIQVKKYVDILHNFQTSADLYGWRNSLSVSATNYYQSDLGCVVEIGRTQVNGPLAALYTVDPTKCHLTGNNETPLRYNNGAKDKQLWEPYDYFRVTSFPNTGETMNGLGYCAVSRCLEIAKVLVSVFEHYRERLGSKAPKGIMTIQGISLEQWLASLEESTDQLQTLEREYYTGVQVLAGENPINVTLTSLSTLPDQFDYDKFISFAMFGYALAFGYDPREFWPVSGGTLGTGKETESQHRKATSKGGLDFALGFQEKIQEELPATIQFEFEQRDAEGDILEEKLNEARLKLVTDMYMAVSGGMAGVAGVPLVSRDEARQLLVDAGLIPEEWTLPEEEVEVTDTDDEGELLEMERVKLAIEKFPDQDIVQYTFSEDPLKDNRYRTLLKAGGRKFSMRIARKMKERAGGSYSDVRASYQSINQAILNDYFLTGGRSTSFKNTMKQNMEESFTSAVEIGYVDGGSELPLEDDVNDFLASAISTESGNIDGLFVSLRLKSKQDDFDEQAEAEARAEGYTNTLDGVYNKAVLYGMGNKMLTFTGDDGAESCATCQMLKGKRHKASWWLAYDYVPPVGEGLDCSGGGHCMHYLEDDDGNEVTV